MESAVYLNMARIEADHWWFRGRRAIVEKVLSAVGIPIDAEVLEVGCGTGGNLGFLAKFGRLSALEPDALARELCERKTGQLPTAGHLPEELPFSNNRFDLIVGMDVIEHVEQDVAALAALASKLKSGGKLLLTVPALPRMWSAHDERHMHFRRYTAASVQSLVEQAGLKVSRCSYFNFFLFLPIVCVRAAKRLLNSESNDESLPRPWINAVLTRIFSAERYFLSRGKLPIGVSLLVLATKA